MTPRTLTEPGTAAVLTAWGLAAACAAAIWSLGGDAFAADQTSRFFGPFLRWAFPHFDEAQHLFWLTALRKTAHVVEYGAFSLLAARALFMSSDWSVGHVALTSVLFAAALSGGDELRQSFSPVRTGSLRDVGLDCTGAATSLALFFAAQRLTGRSWVRRRGAQPSYWPAAITEPESPATSDRV